jgi:hypothetical protein
MDHIWFYVYATPDYRDPAQRRGLVFRQVPGYVWVNQQGCRFHNESRSGGKYATPALMAQSPRHAWAIMDAAMTATMEIADPYYREGDKVVRAKVLELLNSSPFIRKADSSPRSRLIRRPIMRSSSFRWRAKISAALRPTSKCRVLDKHFEPIAGLYAAGELAGMAGGHINGRAGLEGTMLGPSIFSGRVAGGWAAHAAGHGRGFIGMANRN